MGTQYFLPFYLAMGLLRSGLTLPSLKIYKDSNVSVAPEKHTSEMSGQPFFLQETRQITPDVFPHEHRPRFSAVILNAPNNSMQPKTKCNPKRLTIGLDVSETFSTVYTYVTGTVNSRTYLCSIW